MTSPTVSTPDDILCKTRSAIVWSSLLNEPFATLYNIFALLIMVNELQATPFQITLLIILKPVVSLFSFYWSGRIAQRRDSLRSNLLMAGILSRIPFLCFFWIDNVWFLILGCALFMLFSRGGMPAWMEILKRNLSKKQRDKSFSFSQALAYAEGTLIGLGIGVALDIFTPIWKWLFFFSALLGILAVYLQARLPIRGEVKTEKPETVSNFLIPWKNALHLMRTQPDFAHFQWGFMICGFGIMFWQPILPIFFKDILHISYTDLAIAFSICKGMGFVCSSSMWGRALSHFSIAKTTSIVCFFFGLFAISLLFSSYALFLMYFAYLLYGIAQGGSHLLWHLSGPIFSKNDNSSQYSGVNVVMIGIRGMIAPALGGWVCTAIAGPYPVLLIGMIFCFYGSYHMLVKAPSMAPAR